MMADLPHTLYKPLGKNGKPKNSHSKADYDKAAEINARLAREAYERRRAKDAEARPTVEEVFGGALED